MNRKITGLESWNSIYWAILKAFYITRQLMAEDGDKLSRNILGLNRCSGYNTLRVFCNLVTKQCIPVTTAWRVLRLRVEERPSDTESNCEYIQ